jgi:hypothetical protein
VAPDGAAAQSAASAVAAGNPTSTVVAATMKPAASPVAAAPAAPATVPVAAKPAPAASVEAAAAAPSTSPTMP